MNPRIGGGRRADTMPRGRGHTTPMVAVLCIICFFAGRFVQFPAGLPDGATSGRGTAHRKTLLEVADTTQKEATPLEPPATVVRPPVPTQNFSSFEEGVDYLGMLSDRPPVAAGASGHSFYTVQPMQLLSWYPRAYIFPKFMDLEKCNHVKGLAEKKLAPSGLALKRGDSLESTKEIRTSQGTFLARGDDEDGVLAWIEDKIAVLTGIPAGHGEPFNVLRYENTQHYDSHYDVFMTEEYGKQKSNRVATVLVYLSDVEEGGETSFLLEGKDGLKRLSSIDYKSCSTGIKYKPRAGDALLFWSMYPDHTVDKHSLHGGCPVIAGTKWTATKWIRDKCFSGAATCLQDME